MKIKVSLAQIRIVTGDLEGNTNIIIESIQKAIEAGSDIVLLPELCITGYCCGNLFLQSHFINYNKEFLEKVIVPNVPKNLVVILGFVDKNGMRLDGTPNIFNSCAVIQGGKIIGTYDKIHLADSGHHDDKHYFTPGEYEKVFEVEINGEKIVIGTAICEDLWAPKDHSRNVVKECVKMGAQIIFSPNQSYFHYGKNLIRKKVFGEHAKNENVPLFFCNNIGIGDVSKNILSYPGESSGYDSKGNIILQCKSFQEDFQTIEIELINKKQLISNKIIETFEEYSTYKLSKNEKYNQIFNALCFVQKEMFEINGIKKAQIHMSGGIDSSVVLPIVIEAMGKENVIAISNPTNNNGQITKGNAQHICDKLNVKLYWNSMQEPFESYVNSFTQAFKEEPNNDVKTCIHAVGRTVQGLSATHHFKSGIVTTSNHTESVLGWSNFADLGNMGVIGLISDLTKMEVFEMAEFINEKYNDEIIPKNILFNGDFKPAAELPNSTFDGFLYHVVSGICAEIIREKKDPLDLIVEYDEKKLNEDFFPRINGVIIYELIERKDFEKQVWMCFEKSKNSVYKTAQSAPIAMISPVSRGFSLREPLLNKYKCFYNIKSAEKIIQLDIKKIHLKVL